MDISVQPHSDPAAAGALYDRLPADVRAEISEADYVAEAQALASWMPHELTAQNDEIGRRFLRRTRDADFDLAERRRERESIADLHREKWRVLIRRRGEVRLSADGRGVTAVNIAASVMPAMRPRERRAQGGRRSAASRAGTGRDGPSHLAGDAHSTSPPPPDLDEPA